jgi:putative nucleotidyltransferase with HDIG domain
MKNKKTEQSQRTGIRVVSLKDERLAKKITLIFGFMSFVPLLAILWVFISVVFPRVADTEEQSYLRLVLVSIIASILIGYVILKVTMKSLVAIIHKARELSHSQLPEESDHINGDEISELARTFNRVTHELEKKIEELESSRALIKRLLSKIGSAIASYEGIDNMLGLIIENAAVALEADMGSLMLIDGEKQELQVKSAWVRNTEEVKTASMKLGEGIAGWVAKESSITRGSGSAAALGFLDSEHHSKESAVLCIPLNIRDKTIGALSMLRQDHNKQFSEDDEVLLVNIGSQVAVAIENYRLNLDVERTYLETVTALALAVEAKEPYTAGHSRRVGEYAVKIAEGMGADEATKKVLQQGGVLHDVGKIGIKDELLLKADELSMDEKRIMQQHSIIGEAILKPLRSLEKVGELVRCHHEKYDGSGYPSGLKGDQIPLAARILSVADAYDAMMTDRPYRKKLNYQEAKEEFCKFAGTQFDPKVVAALMHILDDPANPLAHP